MRRVRRRHLPLVLLLAGALLGAQWLGAAHRITHAPGAGEPQAAAHEHHSADHGHDHDHDHGYGHDRDSADCRVLDHLLGAAPLAAAPPLVLLLLAAPVSAPKQAAGLAPPAAAWRQPAARGPPATA